MRCASFSRHTSLFHFHDFDAKLHELVEFEVIRVTLDIVGHVCVVGVVWGGRGEREVREAIVVLGYISVDIQSMCKKTIKMQ